MKKCPKCGCEKFVAHQVCRVDIIVDGDNNFLDNLISDKELGDSVYDSETPYGPYRCVECGKEYDELSDIPGEIDIDNVELVRGNENPDSEPYINTDKE